MKRQGLSQREIARKLGISRNTVKKYIENKDHAERDRSKTKRKSQLDPFHGNIVAWLKEDMDYKATWIYDHLRPMGFAGSYEIVKRAVQAIKSERQQIAYMRFETEPGFQAQADFGEFQMEEASGAIKKIYLFSMILGYSRRIYAEFVDQCDLPTFLDCHIRAFEYFGGVTEEILYDRMKNVFIGRISGKDKFNDTLVGFALHYGFKPLVAPAYAAWVCDCNQLSCPAIEPASEPKFRSSHAQLFHPRNPARPVSSSSLPHPRSNAPADHRQMLSTIR